MTNTKIALGVMALLALSGIMTASADPSASAQYRQVNGPGVISHQNVGAIGLGICFIPSDIPVINCEPAPGQIAGFGAGFFNASAECPAGDSRCLGTVWVECDPTGGRCNWQGGFSFDVCNDRDDNTICENNDAIDHDTTHNHGTSADFDDQSFTGYSLDDKGDTKDGDHSGSVDFEFCHDADTVDILGDDGVAHNWDDFVVFIGTDIDDPVLGDELKAGTDFGTFDVYLWGTSSDDLDC